MELLGGEVVILQFCRVHEHISVVAPFLALLTSVDTL